MTHRSRIALKTVAWALCVLPLVVLLDRAFTDGLGANPISYVTNWLGQWTFRLLLVGLALTPLRIVTGLAWPVLLRRLVGLFTFFYASLHFLVWILIDHFFSWDQMLADLVKRRYITVGMLALSLLVPLAITSTNGMVKRLGGTAWRRLHRLVYLIGILAVLHFLWLAKGFRADAVLYAGILALLLGVRLFDALRRRIARPARPAPA
ncbi:MAG: yedZ [candidate division NC10 bacterium]|nr:yedZ [candidate division NC10 bacterium]